MSVTTQDNDILIKALEHFYDKDMEFNKTGDSIAPSYRKTHRPSAGSNMNITSFLDENIEIQTVYIRDRLFELEQEKAELQDELEFLTSIRDDLDSYMKKKLERKNGAA